MTNASGWRFFILYHSLLIKINVNRIGLKINGIWCVLPQDVSITIEEQNPLFSDSGSYSYPIEMSVSQNRELFKSIDSPQGCIRPQDLDGLPFELWYDGNMLLYGITETDEDLEVDGDKCTINLVSGNGDFQSKIEGLQCTDVPLMDELLLGHCYTSVNVSFYMNNKKTEKEIFLDEVNSMSLNHTNVSTPYEPGSSTNPYCNVRVCTKRKGDYDKEAQSPYMVHEADRPNSGLCFYVGYFLASLFSHLGFAVKENNLGRVEDMKRLAFFTTKCLYEKGELEEYELNPKNLHVKDGFTEFYITGFSAIPYISNISAKVRRYPVYANSKNFPETDVSSVVESLFNAFGLKIICNPNENSVSLYYIRDILRDPEVIDAPMTVRSSSVSYEKVKGVRLTYGGDDEDTAFVYKDFKKDNVKSIPDYKSAVTNVQANDKTCYVSQVTGNKYRIKIDKDAEEEGDEKNLNPALFEVAQFNDYVLGEDTEDAVELKLSFMPLIENDVTSKSLMNNENYREQTLAVYIDGVELGEPEVETQLVEQFILPVETPNGGGTSYGAFPVRLSQHRHINYDRSSGTEDPFQSHDSGFTLGVMRGAGSRSSVVVTLENYDGNGNSAYATVADDYAFTADSMDAYGNHYDYNGDLEGGVVGLEDTISLKTHIHTAKDVGLEGQDWGIDAQAAKRGLADRFMSEYMYFLLHRKTVSMDVDTTLSQLTSLSWFKQLRIDGTVGRLKSRTYTLSNEGVTDQGIELYTIN